jgi:hypothetical protein
VGEMEHDLYQLAFAGHGKGSPASQPQDGITNQRHISAPKSNKKGTKIGQKRKEREAKNRVFVVVRQKNVWISKLIATLFVPW